MTKKNKRQKISKGAHKNKRPKKLSGTQNNSRLAEESVDRLTPRAPSISQVIEFSPDYTHVKKDLARIGTLAGFFLVVLVVLSFFIK